MAGCFQAVPYCSNNLSIARLNLDFRPYDCIFNPVKSNTEDFETLFENKSFEHVWRTPNGFKVHFGLIVLILTILLSSKTHTLKRL